MDSETIEKKYFSWGSSKLICASLIGLGLILLTVELWHWKSRQNLPSEYPKIHSGMSLSDVQGLDIDFMSSLSSNLRTVTQFYQTQGNDTEFIRVDFQLDGYGDYRVTKKSMECIDNEEELLTVKLCKSLMARVNARFDQMKDWWAPTPKQGLFSP